MTKTLGQLIRELRERKDLSLREFAGKLDVSAPFLSDIELGKRNPSNKVLSRIAQLLGISVEELRRHDTRPPVEELRRLATADPSYGLAFRMLIDKKLSSEDLLNIVKSKESKASRKKR